jgi:hypothetical protein
VNSINEPIKRRLLEVLRRATDDDPAARYASVIEFWSDLAQVASEWEEAKADETSGDADDVTIIKPRLNVAPGTMPNGPERPTFDPALATTRFQVSLKNATLVENPRAVQSPANRLPFEGNDLNQAQPAQRSKQTDHTSKFFIELQAKAKEDTFKTQVLGEPPAARGDFKSPAKAETQAPAEPSIAKRKKKVADNFNWEMRRRIFIGLIVVAFLGVIVSVFNYVRSQPAPFGFGPPTEIEIVTEGLNVRSAPSPSRERQKVLGSVGKGSRHEVLEQADNWLRIRVRSWAKKEPNVDTDTGWVYGDLDGNPPNVRVVSRKFWR